MEWAPPEKLHLTLNFMGQFDDKQIGAAQSVLARQIAAFPSFSSPLSTVETMYHRHEPTIIYIQPSKCPELMELQSALSVTLEDMDSPQPRRYFPQLTIGQFVKADPTTMKRFMDTFSDFELTDPLPEIPVTKIHLFESLTSKTGTYYRRMTGFPLSAGQAI